MNLYLVEAIRRGMSLPTGFRIPENVENKEICPKDVKYEWSREQLLSVREGIQQELELDPNSGGKKSRHSTQLAFQEGRYEAPLMSLNGTGCNVYHSYNKVVDGDEEASHMLVSSYVEPKNFDMIG